MLDTIICNKYDIKTIIGYGKFGTVYRGKHIDKDNMLVAIKTEDTNSRFKVLRHEVTVLNYLFYNGVRNIPNVYWFGQHLNHTCLIMSYYTCSLDDYIIQKGIMDNKQLGSMMIKCLNILDHIHKYHILHRDIKPQNFMINDGDIFLIDFGLSTVFVDDDGKHIIKKDIDNIIGTPKYVSYYNHNGENISRRDDLISLGYMYLYLQDGLLPWNSELIPESSCDIPITNVLYHRNIALKKSKTWDKISNYTENAIHMFFKYCYELKYDDEPNYNSLMELFIK